MERRQIAAKLPQVVLVGSVMRGDRPSEVAVADPLLMDDSARTFNVALDRSVPTVETTRSVYEPHSLTHLNDDVLQQVELPKLESFWFTGAEGTKVRGVHSCEPPGV